MIPIPGQAWELTLSIVSPRSIPGGKQAAVDDLTATSHNHDTIRVRRMQRSFANVVAALGQSYTALVAIASFDIEVANKIIGFYTLDLAQLS
jgi:hypothetical protein